MARWIPFAIPGGLLLSNSSSILPWEIHPAVLGFHLFYPSVICGFCEVVAPESVEDGLLGRLLSLSQRLGLHPLVQVGPARAFAVNRLFLPAQAWAVRRVLSGVSAAVVDEAFGRAWPGLRPLVFTESVGFTTTSRAVARYRSRMPEAVAADYGELEATIRELLTQGRTGFSSDGEPGAEGSEGASPEEVLDAEALFWNTCLWAREVGDLDDEELDTVLSGILDSRWPPPSLRASTEDLLTRCQQRWQETRLSWWRPASAPSGPSARGGVRERAGGSTEEGGG